MKEGAYLYLRITGENLDFLGLTQKTKLNPSITYRKNDCLSNMYGKTVCSTDCWQADYEISPEQSLEEAIIDFLHAFLEKGNEFAWPDNAHAEFWISLYPEERYMSLCFSESVLSMLSTLKVTMGIVVTGLSDFYGKL